MTLGDILTPESLVPELQARNRWEAIDELIDRLVAAGRIEPGHREAVTGVIQRRERSIEHGHRVRHRDPARLHQPHQDGRRGFWAIA